MNVEIAQRLAELRREKGFSQEELAEQLGLSRQAVSKWERAESSPDTGNLIALAKLYGVTLDDLLQIDVDIEDDVKFEAKDRETSAETQAQAAADKASASATQASVAASQAHAAAAQATASATQVSTAAVQPQPAAQQPGTAQAYTHHQQPASPYSAPQHPQGTPVPPPVPVVPVQSEGQRSERKHKGPWSSFPYPVLCVIIFLIAGFFFSTWAIAWIVFLTIPLYYWIAHTIENDPNYIEQHKEGK